MARYVSTLSFQVCHAPVSGVYFLAATAGPAHHPHSGAGGSVVGDVSLLAGPPTAQNSSTDHVHSQATAHTHTLLAFGEVEDHHSTGGRRGDCAGRGAPDGRMDRVGGGKERDRSLE